MLGSTWPCAARADRPSNNIATNNNVNNNSRAARTTIAWSPDPQQPLLSIPQPQTVFPCEDLLPLTGPQDLEFAPYPQDLSKRFSLVGNSPYWTHFRDKRAGLLARFNYLCFASANAGEHGSEQAARTLSHQADCIKVEMSRLDADANAVYEKDVHSAPGQTLPRVRAVVHIASDARRDAQASVERAESGRARLDRADLPVSKQPPLAPGMGLMWKKYVDKRNSLLHEVMNLITALNKLGPRARTPQNMDFLAAQERDIGGEIESLKGQIKALDLDIEFANTAAMKVRELELFAVAQREMADYELRTGTRLGPNQAWLERNSEPEQREESQSSDGGQAAAVVHMPIAREVPPPLAALRALPDPTLALPPFALPPIGRLHEVDAGDSVCRGEPYFNFTSVYIAHESFEPLTQIGDQSLVAEAELPAG